MGNCVQQEEEEGTDQKAEGVHCVKQTTVTLYQIDSSDTVSNKTEQSYHVQQVAQGAMCAIQTEEKPSLSKRQRRGHCSHWKGIVGILLNAQDSKYFVQ